MMVILANQVTHRSMWWNMIENSPFKRSSWAAKKSKSRWFEFPPQVQDSILLSFPLEFSTPPAMLSFCAKPEGGVAESIRISYGFCNFGHECPSCRTTFWNRWERILRCQWLSGYFWINVDYLGKSIKPALYVMGYAGKHTLHPFSLQHKDN